MAMVEQNSINPINAIKNFFSSMSVEQQAKFYQETGLNFANINIMDYDAAVKYCKSHNIDLSPVTLWANQQTKKDAFFESYMARIDKHNEESEKLIARYKELEKLANIAKAKQTEKRNDLFGKYGVKNLNTFNALKKAGGIATVDSDALNLLTKSADDALSAYEIALSTANEHTHHIVT